MLSAKCWRMSCILPAGYRMPLPSQMKHGSPTSCMPICCGCGLIRGSMLIGLGPTLGEISQSLDEGLQIGLVVFPLFDRSLVKRLPHLGIAGCKDGAIQRLIVKARRVEFQAGMGQDTP